MRIVEKRGLVIASTLVKVFGNWLLKGWPMGQRWFRIASYIRTHNMLLFLLAVCYAANMKSHANTQLSGVGTISCSSSSFLHKVVASLTVPSREVIIICKNKERFVLCIEAVLILEGPFQLWRLYYSVSSEICVTHLLFCIRVQWIGRPGKPRPQHSPGSQRAPSPPAPTHTPSNRTRPPFPSPHALLRGEPEEEGEEEGRGPVSCHQGGSPLSTGRQLRNRPARVPVDCLKTIEVSDPVTPSCGSASPKSWRKSRPPHDHCRKVPQHTLDQRVVTEKPDCPMKGVVLEAEAAERGSRLGFAPPQMLGCLSSEEDSWLLFCIQHKNCWVRAASNIYLMLAMKLALRYLS